MDLLALIGKGKPKGEADEGMASAKPEGAEREFAREVYSAAQEQDEEGFVEALVSTIKACVNKAGSGGYADEE